MFARAALTRRRTSFSERVVCVSRHATLATPSYLVGSDTYKPLAASHDNPLASAARISRLQQCRSVFSLMNALLRSPRVLRRTRRTTPTTTTRGTPRKTTGSIAGNLECGCQSLVTRSDAPNGMHTPRSTIDISSLHRSKMRRSCPTRLSIQQGPQPPRLTMWLKLIPYPPTAGAGSSVCFGPCASDVASSTLSATRMRICSPGLPLARRPLIRRRPLINCLQRRRQIVLRNCSPSCLSLSCGVSAECAGSSTQSPTHQHS